MFQMSLTTQKVDYVFQELRNLHITVGGVQGKIIDGGVQGKIKPTWRNYLI